MNQFPEVLNSNSHNFPAVVSNRASRINKIHLNPATVAFGESLFLYQSRPGFAPAGSFAVLKRSSHLSACTKKSNQKKVHPAFGFYYVKLSSLRGNFSGRRNATSLSRLRLIAASMPQCLLKSPLHSAKRRDSSLAPNTRSSYGFLEPSYANSAERTWLGAAR